MTNIINIKHKKDLITLDLRTKQIRYLKDINNFGEILFYNISRDDSDGYLYLFNSDKNLFLKTLKEDIKSFFNINIDLNKLEIQN